MVNVLADSWGKALGAIVSSFLELDRNDTFNLVGLNRNTRK